jgi:hypothetical protein
MLLRDFFFWLVGTVIRDEVGLTLDKVGKEVLGHASKVVLTKDTTTIVGDGSTQEAVNKRVAQIRNLIEVYISRPHSLSDPLVHTQLVSARFILIILHLIKLVCSCRLQSKTMRRKN